jgi:hypothetical protein
VHRFQSYCVVVAIIKLQALGGRHYTRPESILLPDLVRGQIRFYCIIPFCFLERGLSPNNLRVNQRPEFVDIPVGRFSDTGY